MASVAFEKASKTFPDGTQAVHELTLDIADSEFVVLVGPSGCGKTTALRMVAGLEEISTGTVRIGGEAVNAFDPRKRDIAMIFQNYALYPHMTIFENIAFPLRTRRLSNDDIAERVTRTAQLLGISDLLKKRPKTLSGGQRQRVAMGRALVRDPQVFLMDEPLSNLDAKLRVQMRAEIAKLQHDLGATTIYVTHDQIEAMTMGDRIAVMRKGVLQQFGPPQTIYDEPANLFVATFIGSPAMNLFEARLVPADGGLACVIGNQALPLPNAITSAWKQLPDHLNTPVALGIRPEHLAEPGSSRGTVAPLRGTVSFIEALGSELHVHVDVEATPVLSSEVREVALDTDAATLTALEQEAKERRVPAIARFSATTVVRVGDVVELEVATDHLLFFDLASGAGLR